MVDFENLIPISAISHYLYCPRQAALIHVEQVFVDNALTISGDIGHENVNRERGEIDHGVRKEYSLRVFSDNLGLIGVADVIEFQEGCPPLPIDYKHGRISKWANHEAQVAAIALCLEEMLAVKIEKGAIYHIQSKRRRVFEITEALRELTKQTIFALREMIEKQAVPPGEYIKKCYRCSLLKVCMPKIAALSKPDVFQPI